MKTYEGVCTCGANDCARTLRIEPVYAVTVTDTADKISATEFLSRARLLDWLSSDDDCFIQDELSIEPDASAVQAWLDAASGADLRRQLAEAETALLAVPLDSIRRWMGHSDAIEAVAAGDYDAGEGMLDVYLIRDWLSGLATDDTPATGEAESAMGTIRLSLPQLEAGQAEISALRRASGDVVDYGRAAVAEAEELRRQLEHANRWRDTAIVEANEARAEAADLRRQLDEAKAEIAALRIENAALAAIAAICPTCGGSGEVDSGGVSPWGVGIDVTCPTCNGSGKAYDDDTPAHRPGKGDAR